MSLQQDPVNPQLGARRVDLLMYDLHGCLAISCNDAIRMAGAEVVQHSVDGDQLCWHDCVCGPIAAWCKSQADISTFTACA